jgi:hypothetical protein
VTEHELYPDPPRRVVLTLAALGSMTVLERARACAIVGIPERDLVGLLRTVQGGRGDPHETETGVLLLYALCWQLERRRDPAMAWETVQTFDLVIDLETRDPIAEAEAHASVDAAIATGLPPAVAGDLTMDQLERYSERAKERETATRRGRR